MPGNEKSRIALLEMAKTHLRWRQWTAKEEDRESQDAHCCNVLELDIRRRNMKKTTTKHTQTETIRPYRWRKRQWHTQSTCTCTVKKEEEVKRNYLSSAIESLLLFFYFVRESLFPICDGAISSDKLEATDHRSSDRAGGASSSPGDLPDRLPIMLSPFCALSGKSLLVCLKDEIFWSP